MCANFWLTRSRVDLVGCATDGVSWLRINSRSSVVDRTGHYFTQGNKRGCAEMNQLAPGSIGQSDARNAPQTVESCWTFFTLAYQDTTFCTFFTLAYQDTTFCTILTRSTVTVNFKAISGLKAGIHKFYFDNQSVLFHDLAIRNGMSANGIPT